MRAVIVAQSAVSPQHTHDAEHFPAVVNEVISNRLTCIEPEYKLLINPMQLRRMPRILKMGLAASQLCINRSGGIRPDGIIVGTGLGCLDNLEKFLLEVLNTNERITSVLPFINSTHNAVAAQIALMQQNQNYNVTYCHRGFSFETALLDALMLINENNENHILAGGIDECTNDFMQLYSYHGMWKQPGSNLALLSEKTNGTIAGEGAAFFMLSGSTAYTGQQVIIEGVHTFFTPDGATMAVIEAEISRFLNSCRVGKNNLEGVLLGLNGDINHDAVFYELMDSYFGTDAEPLYYKHLCGEYYTSSAFALWLGSTLLRDKQIPAMVRVRKGKLSALKNLLIYNQVNNTEHTLILLSYGHL